MKHPLPTFEQNVLMLAWELKKLPSEILAEDEYWINRLILDVEAKAKAR